jgi:hypothetical protein
MTFDMSEAWREATVMIKANREVLTIIAGIFVFLPGVLAGFALPEMNASFDNPAAMQAQVLAFYADWGWALLLMVLLQVAGYLAMLALLRDRSRPTVGQAIGAGLKGLLPAIGAYLLFLLAMIPVALVLILVVALLAVVAGEAGSTIVGVVLGMGMAVFFIYALVKLSLWAPVIAIDKVHNPLAVLRRSWRMTKGKSLPLFLFYLLLAVVYVVITIVVGMVAGALALVLGASAGVIVSALLSGFLGAVAAVIYVAVLAAIHRQLSGPWAAPVERAKEEPLD